MDGWESPVWAGGELPPEFEEPTRESTGYRTEYIVELIIDNCIQISAPLLRSILRIIFQYQQHQHCYVLRSISPNCGSPHRENSAALPGSALAPESKFSPSPLFPFRISVAPLASSRLQEPFARYFIFSLSLSLSSSPSSIPF